jgi:hypothetical protein
MKNTLPDLTEQYKTLTLKLDLLKKEFSELYSLKNEMLTHRERFLTALYLDMIGSKQYQKYCITVEIAMIKQRIEMIQSFLNRNEQPNLKAIEREINKRFAEYQKKIEEEAQRIADADAYLKTSYLPEDEVKKLKEVYRVIVKKLHPDINPNTTELQKDILVKAQSAYDLCDLHTLNQILITLNIGNNATDKHNVEPIILEKFVAQLEVNVSKLKKQVEELQNRFPFIYESRLTDNEWIKNEQRDLEVEIITLTKERQDLSEYILALKTWKPESLN